MCRVSLNIHLVGKNLSIFVGTFSWKSGLKVKKNKIIIKETYSKEYVESATEATGERR